MTHIRRVEVGRTVDGEVEIVEIATEYPDSTFEVEESADGEIVVRETIADGNRAFHYYSTEDIEVVDA